MSESKPITKADKKLARFQFVSNTASSKRFHHVRLFTHPYLLTCRCNTHKKARRVLRHGKHWHKAYEYTKPNYSASKVLFYFQINERKCKKMLKLTQKVVSLRQFCSDLLLFHRFRINQWIEKSIFVRYPLVAFTINLWHAPTMCPLDTNWEHPSISHSVIDWLSVL